MAARFFTIYAAVAVVFSAMFGAVEAAPAARAFTMTRPSIRSVEVSIWQPLMPCFEMSDENQYFQCAIAAVQKQTSELSAQLGPAMDANGQLNLQVIVDFISALVPKCAALPTAAEKWTCGTTLFTDAYTKYTGDENATGLLQFYNSYYDKIHSCAPVAPTAQDRSTQLMAEVPQSPCRAAVANPADKTNDIVVYLP